MKSSGILEAHESSNVFPFEVCNLLLGKGGSGQVFLGRIGGSGKYVAIKKQYSRYNGNKSAGAYTLPRSSGLPRSLQRTKSQLSRSPLVSSLGRNFVCRSETRLQQLEVGSCVPVSQRRELDLGEESVSQMAALSQQHGNYDEEISSGDAAKQKVIPLVMDEISVLSYLGPHPQIVRFLGSYTTSKNTNFFTMELMDSDVGREMREGNTTLREEGVCAAIAYSVLLALEEMHSHAVAHRDVKPGNILLKRLTEAEEWSCVYLSKDDFSSRLLPKSSTGPACKLAICTGNEESSHEIVPGIRSTNDSASYVKAALGDFSAAHSTCCADGVAFSDTRGTLHYKSPEQLMGKRSIVSENFAAVDLWGLGCTLYEMVTGTRPFPGSSELQVLMSILEALGSDIQSFPVATKHAVLFDEIPASPIFVDFLRRLLCLDPTRRCTAKEALCHSFLASIRDSTLSCAEVECQISTGRLPYVIGIPLTLKYASFTHIPELRFSLISRTPLKATGLASAAVSAPQEHPLSDCPAPPCASDSEVAALTVVAEREVVATPQCSQGDVNHSGDRATSTLWKQQGDCENQEEKETPSQKLQQQLCSDTTGTSFLSESSYLHWSEIRPAARPSAPPLPKPLYHKEDRVRSSSGCRAVAFFGNSAVGNTPSPSASGNEPQPLPQSFSDSMHRAADIGSRNTVSRALNISGSSVKGVRTERSASHVDFDLSPVPATQLFSTETDTSACLVPHPVTSLPPRRAQPVLQLPSGSTFTASNLRANSSFERENFTVGQRSSNGASTSVAVGFTGPMSAIHSGHCSTPRRHHGQRPTTFSGRALCFSEETDPFTRRSWGSSAGQQSCLNSLLTSPAPVGQPVVEECSPQPSPIHSVGVATRSPSGLPVAADRSGFSFDDSAVGLGWISMQPTTSAVRESMDADTCEAAAAPMPALARDLSRGSETNAMVAPPMLCSVRLQPSWNASHTMATGVAQPPNSSCVRWCMHLEPPPGGCLHSRNCPAVALMTGVTTATAAERTDASCRSQQQRPTASPTSTDGRDASRSRIMPLPIPLSVATVCQSATQSLCAPTPRSRTPTSRALHETPRTQRFSCPTSDLRTGHAGHKNGNQRFTSQPQGTLTSCVYDGDNTLSAAPFLCNQDVNAPVTHVAPKVCMSVDLTECGAGAAPALLCAAALPLGSPAASTHPSPLHCTPSSSNAAPEIALSIDRDSFKNPTVAMETFLTSTVTAVGASGTALAAGGPHTPLPVHGPASLLSQSRDAPMLRLTSASLDRHHWSVKSHESDRIETPQSKQRESMKRAREEAMNSEDVATVRQSARVV
ncbi:protein kinase, putative [Leishmania tarentolae]|uniref:Protein kinase, putative n=1 Tax=Leishmania tarentolae TaxID=5689 RepID=A0A640KGR7_LEITA|nr:protein kinase, putative [Leishmania tarentolae]